MAASLTYATHLEATLTNKATCLDGLIGMTRPEMNGLLGSLDDTYEHVSNSRSRWRGFATGGCSRKTAESLEREES